MKILCMLPVDTEQKQILQNAAPGAEFLYYDQTPPDAVLAGIDICLGSVPPDLISKAPNLKFVQTNSSGADRYKFGVNVPKDLVLCSATGVYGEVIAEYLIALLFSLAKNLHSYRDLQKKASWVELGGLSMVIGSTVLLIGLGNIGSSFATKIKALGAYVIGVRRNEAPKPDYVDEVYTNEAIDRLLPLADTVVLSLPNTKETYHLMNYERLQLMKRSAFLLNVGRGTVVDTAALTKALQEGLIAGAGMDVLDPEPLPVDHPLWQEKNVIITPHIAGPYSKRYTMPYIAKKMIEHIARNLDAYLTGKPLLSRIDPETGYREFVG